MKHAAMYALIGLALVGLGIVRGGWALLLVWPGLSFVATGLGHAGLGARIYGKTEAGRLQWWGKAAHLPFLLFTWGVWHVGRALSRESPYDEVTQDLVVGRRLLLGERPDDIRNWVDLTAEFDEPHQIISDTNYVCLPTLDGGVPRPNDFADALSRIEPGRTYVHCAQGHGRAALFALGALVKNGTVANYEEGLRLLRERRPRVRLNGRQEGFARKELPWQGPR